MIGVQLLPENKTIIFYNTYIEFEDIKKYFIGCQYEYCILINTEIDKEEVDIKELQLRCKNIIEIPNFLKNKEIVVDWENGVHPKVVKILDLLREEKGEQ